MDLKRTHEACSLSLQMHYSFSPFIYTHSRHLNGPVFSYSATALQQRLSLNNANRTSTQALGPWELNNMVCARGAGGGVAGARLSLVKGGWRSGKQAHMTVP